MYQFGCVARNTIILELNTLAIGPYDKAEIGSWLLSLIWYLSAVLIDWKIHKQQKILSMAILVVEFSREGYKIKNKFG